MTPYTSQRGFTLVELAISLVVIGLLIGGILKGQELVRNSRITAMIQEMKTLEAGVRQFRDAYGAIPGDLPDPGSRLRGCVAPSCNTSEVSNGDGRIGTVEESRKFWQHLGVSQGLKNVDMNEMDYQRAAPPNALKGHNIIWFNIITVAPDVVLDGNIYSLAEGGASWSRMRLRNAVLLDTKMDDGKPHSGDLLSDTSPVCNEAGENTYLTTPPTQECHIMMRVQGDE